MSPSAGEQFSLTDLIRPPSPRLEAEAAAPRDPGPRPDTDDPAVLDEWRARSRAYLDYLAHKRAAHEGPQLLPTEPDPAAEAERRRQELRDKADRLIAEREAAQAAPAENGLNTPFSDPPTAELQPTEIDSPAQPVAEAIVRQPTLHVLRGGTKQAWPWTCPFTTQHLIADGFTSRLGIATSRSILYALALNVMDSDHGIWGPLHSSLHRPAKKGKRDRPNKLAPTLELKRPKRSPRNKHRHPEDLVTKVKISQRSFETYRAAFIKTGNIAYRIVPSLSGGPGVDALYSFGVAIIDLLPLDVLEKWEQLQAPRDRILWVPRPPAIASTTATAERSPWDL